MQNGDAPSSQLRLLRATEPSGIGFQPMPLEQSSADFPPLEPQKQSCNLCGTEGSFGHIRLAVPNVPTTNVTTFPARIQNSSGSLNAETNGIASEIRAKHASETSVVYQKIQITKQSAKTPVPSRQTCEIRQVHPPNHNLQILCVNHNPRPDQKFKQNKRERLFENQGTGATGRTESASSHFRDLQLL